MVLKTLFDCTFPFDQQSHFIYIIKLKRNTIKKKNILRFIISLRIRSYMQIEIFFNDVYNLNLNVEFVSRFQTFPIIAIWESDCCTLCNLIVVVTLDASFSVDLFLFNNSSPLKSNDRSIVLSKGSWFIVDTLISHLYSRIKSDHPGKILSSKAKLQI